MDSTRAHAHHMARLDPEQILRREITALRAEIAALRSNQAQNPQNNSTHAAQRDTDNFFSLPPEIRNAIYDACVVIGDVRVNCPGHVRYDDMRFRALEAMGHRGRVNLSLFAVNRQMRHEALGQYQFGNRFIIPVTRQTFHLAAADDQAWRIFPGLYTTQPCHVRSISIAIDNRQWDGKNAEAFVWWTDVNAPDYSDWSDSYRISTLHGTLEEAFWEETAGDMIKNVFETFPNLREIQINVENAYCPMHCHRVASKVFRYLRRQGVLEALALRQNPYELKKIDFLGTVTTAERNRIRDQFPVALQELITFHGEISWDHNERLWLWDMSVEIDDETSTDGETASDSSDDAGEE